MAGGYTARNHRHQAHALVEEPTSRVGEQQARRSSKCRLQQPDDEQAVAGQLEHHREQVRIERRLVEDRRAEPLATGNLARPAHVLTAVANQAVSYTHLTLPTIYSV